MLSEFFYIFHAYNVVKEKKGSRTGVKSICTGFLLASQYFFEFSGGAVELHKIVVILKTTPKETHQRDEQIFEMTQILKNVNSRVK